MNSLSRVDTVRLHSRVGVLHLTRRQELPSGEKTKIEYNWDFDNSFTAEVPKDYWERLSDQYLDRANSLKYNEALLEI